MKLTINLVDEFNALRLLNRVSNQMQKYNNKLIIFIKLNGHIVSNQTGVRFED